MMGLGRVLLLIGYTSLFLFILIVLFPSSVFLKTTAAHQKPKNLFAA